MPVTPYLFYEGRAEEAIGFYTTALGAETIMLLRNSEAPDQPPPGMMPPDSGNKIMHAEIRIGDDVLMISDGFCSGVAAFAGFGISLQVKDAEEASRRFNALADGGEVRMPLGPTFFSPAFGMVADRFGVLWILAVPQEKA